MNNQGWLKLHRKLKETSWFKRSTVVHLFVYLLLSANREENKLYWNGKEELIKKGELLTGRKELSKLTGISQRSIRTALTILKSTSTVAIKTTNKFSIISILKWEDYQDLSTTISTTISTNNRPTTDQQLTTNNKYKKYKNKEKHTIGVDISYLENLKDDEIDKYVKSYLVTAYEVRKKAEELLYYCKRNGKNYKDYKAFLQGAILRDYGKREFNTRLSRIDQVINSIPETQ